ncbi:MAG: GWxTD domain-containing protein [Candidatus Cloacimonadaceae bacterium]|nr:GWxTD domain-containing protein [Candidatus Cloacimonadota bacterium]MDX9950091.1 GWxTD domain-containing protein [Candidatus Syntrophosphaera sp.]NLN84482.1 GWxTD domain-containing protein [Candidatus Cloacimonadota bacterium]
MTKKKIRLCLVLLAIAVFLPAQELIVEHYSQGTDIWILIPYNTLVFKKDVFESNYQLVMELKNNKTKKIHNFDASFRVPRQDWLRDAALPVMFSAQLEPGSYQASMRLRNLTQGEKSDYKRAFTLGDKHTEIGQAWLLAQKEGVLFQPPDLEKLPLPLEGCVLKQKIGLEADSVHVVGIEPIQSFLPPLAYYEADLTELANAGALSQLGVSVFEGNIRYDMEPFLFSPWFSYNARYSFKDQIQQLRYIANQNEYKSLRSIPESQIPDAIEKFWQVRDPSPGTLRNEAREAFYQRVITADENFTIHKRLKGWKSDRGRIYIKYGEPSEILSESQPLGRDPYIIWSYYQQNLEFIFTDSGGFGLYQLRNKDEEY